MHSFSGAEKNNVTESAEMYARSFSRIIPGITVMTTVFNLTERLFEDYLKGKIHFHRGMINIDESLHIDLYTPKKFEELGNNLKNLIEIHKLSHQDLLALSIRLGVLTGDSFIYHTYQELSESYNRLM